MLVSGKLQGLCGNERQTLWKRMFVGCVLLLNDDCIILEISSAKKSAIAVMANQEGTTQNYERELTCRK